MSEGESEKVALAKRALVKLKEARDVLSDFKEQNQSILRQEKELEAVCLSEEAACQRQLNDWFWGKCRNCGNRWWELKGVILTAEDVGVENFNTWGRYVMAGSWDACSCCYKCAGGMNVKKDKLP